MLRFSLPLGILALAVVVRSDDTSCHDMMSLEAYKEAFALWEEPACYSFSYINKESYNGTTVRTVRNGTSFQDGDGNGPFQTLADVWAIARYINRCCCWRLF
ncbi:hypothetical protein FisN_15Lu361 [Fistulifera solaris]|uniref:Uncharacterized protein n=1 Tax=Fistulifera solaris TaxID=1519565 RepID=A0A1Z5JZI6_FISSO|nr:hypothetical protein FisN_15Lu361 [Fistulifera solaris]|eukprot:GAX19181.1 hypothetical protein FisN_15Lu361 [Fistulifera solaris]